MNDGPDYGATRKRMPSVSYADIEAAARRLMADGGYPSVAAVRQALKRGSSTTIAEAMRRFWKDQAALTAGNPTALTRLPPDFADAAARLWEQALTLAQQSAQHDDTAAQERLKQIAAEQEVWAHALTLREKEWETAARDRERALADAREHLLLLSKSLGRDQATLQARDARIIDLEAQIAHYRQQIAELLAGAIVRQRSAPRRAPAKPTAPHSRSRQRAIVKRVNKARTKRKAARSPKPATRRRLPKPSPRRKR